MKPDGTTERLQLLFGEARQTHATPIMAGNKELYPVYEKKIENETANTPDRAKKEKKSKYSRFVSTSLMFLLEPILPDDGVKGDGKIASVMYLICLTTAGVVFNLSQWLQADAKADSGVTADHIDGFLITCILPALLWICYIFCKQNDRKTVDFITPSPHSHRPLMAGAYVFGAGSCVMDLLHIAFYVECSSNLPSLFFSVFKAVFIFSQILFLRKFATATLHKSPSIRLVLFHILGTNVCIWFRALFSHSRSIFSVRGTTTLDSAAETECIALHYSMSKIWEASEPYLYPFTMEYSLIAGGILYNMWSGMRDLDPDPQDIYIYDELSDFNTTSDNLSERLEKFEEDHGYGTCEAHTPSRDSVASSRFFSRFSLNRAVSNSSICQTCVDNGMVRNTSVPSSDPGLLVGLLFSTLLLLAVGLLWVDKQSSNALRFYYLYQITLLTFMCISCWVILKCLMNQKFTWYPLAPDDTLLIASFSGLFLYAGLCLTAGIAEYKNKQLISSFSIAKSTLILFQAMLQASAVIKALRFKPIDEIGANVIRQGALFLLTTNFALWAQDSFFELRNFATTPVQTVFYGEKSWRAITTLAYPLCIFFRFHSAACLFEVWSSFRMCR
ncbi:predicted protein [Nematostella vectensis]|uniref:Uncharacterized protein n=1 Tax=Nematostella vectensis TaxID=45351 RepID=A7RK62_NEMVE|nr:proton channel OtopLc [Nematostella vectensis]EDO48113.1 predicted protein [Nematostella vectensis]|eukprot:XP_001640176.1 predicted protein [Nematostella vectensis]